MLNAKIQSVSFLLLVVGDMDKIISPPSFSCSINDGKVGLLSGSFQCFFFFFFNAVISSSQVNYSFSLR